MSELSARETLIETPHLELHHICASELISLYETPEDSWIFEGKSFNNPHREIMDKSGRIA